MIKLSENKNLLNNRHELVFIYDVRDANPNGDPDNSNMPRMDDETEQNIVTDVRLKRTIRDYWLDLDENVLVRAETDSEGNRKTMDDLASEFLDMDSITKKNAGEARAKLAEDLPKEYLDVRTFGAAVTLKKANFSITGTVQFGLGRSLNKPTINTKTITTTLASTKEKGQGTFGEYHFVDYSILKFHGIANELNAQKNHYTKNDLLKLYKGLWFGTKQLNTRSKFNHLPRLLIDVESNSGKAQIGDLDLGFTLKKEEGLKSVEDVKLNLSDFVNRVKKELEKIKSIKLLYDTDLEFYSDDTLIEDLKSHLEKELKNTSIKLLNLNEE